MSFVPVSLSRDSFVADVRQDLGLNLACNPAEVATLSKTLALRMALKRLYAWSSGYTCPLGFGLGRQTELEFDTHLLSTQPMPP